MIGGDDVQLVTFRVGPQEFAFDILQVERILRYEKPAPLPGAPPFLEGVVRYDAGALPVVDLRKRLEVPAVLREETRLVVLALADQRIGVLVDEVCEVLRVDGGTIAAPAPLVRGLAAEYIAGIVTRRDRVIIVLHARRILSSTERLALAGAAVA